MRAVRGQVPVQRGGRASVHLTCVEQRRGCNGVACKHHAGLARFVGWRQAS
jgi:hypothetical protein